MDLHLKKQNNPNLERRGAPNIRQLHLSSRRVIRGDTLFIKYHWNGWRWWSSGGLVNESDVCGKLSHINIEKHPMSKSLKKNGLSLQDNNRIIELVKAKIRPMHRRVFKDQSVESVSGRARWCHQNHAQFLSEKEKRIWDYWPEGACPLWDPISEHPDLACEKS